MENRVIVSKNDRQDRSLTGQVRYQAGHCPLTGRYLQPWNVEIILFILRVHQRAFQYLIYPNTLQYKTGFKLA